MFVDSHCHLDFPALQGDVDDILQKMAANQVEHALVVSVNLPDWPELLQLVEAHDNLSASVGVHPGYPDTPEPDVAELVRLSGTSERVVAIGETGLDYFRQSEPLDWQRERFRVHIRASRETGLPLIIHTRAASEDTLQIMRDEGAHEAGGVMHCFTESWEVAQAALDMGFYISFSGIVTFRNATELQEVAQKVPLDRLLIETDSPYLAPVPYRGKRNDPSLVPHVAEKIAELRGESIKTIAQTTTDNFYQLFNKIRR
ncbi:MAG TPA: TatD family hydrolase [Burkholderiaceae bacterium]|nr:TatD family hydrolase [Burkholderiaceae bacterium]